MVARDPSKVVYEPQVVPADYKPHGGKAQFTAGVVEDDTPDFGPQLPVDAHHMTGEEKANRDLVARRAASDVSTATIARVFLPFETVIRPSAAFPSSQEPDRRVKGNSRQVQA